MRMRHRDPNHGSPTTIQALIYTAPSADTMEVSWSITTYPKIDLEPPDDGREYALHKENLWWIRSEQLAYRAGLPFPLEERPLLIPESQLQALHRAGKRASDA